MVKINWAVAGAAELTVWAQPSAIWLAVDVSEDALRAVSARTPAAARAVLQTWWCARLEGATLTVSTAPDVWHYARWADATVKPWPATTPPWTLQPGDAYVACAPGAALFTDSPATARFIHLRDYFNAARLATALLDEWRAQLSFDARAAVVVVETR